MLEGSESEKGLRRPKKCRASMLNMLAERGMNKIIFYQPIYFVQLIDC